MTTKCPACGLLLDPEATPGVRFGTKREWIEGGGFGAGQGERIANDMAAYFHPQCEPARVGYLEAEVPPHP